MEHEHETKRPLYIPYAGPILLEFPLLNKGSAFTEEERANFNLYGLLPEQVETIEEQVERAYRQLIDFKTDIDKHHPAARAGDGHADLCIMHSYSLLLTILPPD